MSHEQPGFTVHEPNPFLTPPLLSREERAALLPDHNVTTHAAQVASSEAAQRDDALLRAMNPPRVPHVGAPSLRSPDLPAEFASRAATLDQAIYDRGVALSRERLLSLGRERFNDLLARDHSTRELQRVVGTSTDLTSFAGVEFAFAQLNALVTSVPPRKLSEQVAGSGLEREQAAKVAGFDDLWKTTLEQQSVRNVYGFHDAFVRLVFAQSMLERSARDSRLRSHLFCGGNGAKVELFNDWLGVLDGAHVKITIEQPLFSVLTWLTNENSPPLKASDFVREKFNLRAPSRDQIALAQAIFDGFMLDYREWSLWNYVGRRTRLQINQERLEEWRKELARRFSSIAQFHDVMREFFLKPVTISGSGAFQFDSTAHRHYLDRELQKLGDLASQIAAQAVQKTAEGTCVARFNDWLLVEGKAEMLASDRIAEKLNTAFSGTHFNVEAQAI